MIKDLKQASRKNEAPIWSRLADLAVKTVNIKASCKLGKNKQNYKGEQRSICTW